MSQTFLNAFLFFLTFISLSLQSAQGLCFNPDIYHDRILVQSGGKIWIGSLQGNGYVAYPLHNFGGHSKYPKFSKEGDKIAFISNFETGNSYEIYVTDIDGNSLERISYEALGSEDEIFFQNNQEITFSCLTKQSHRESCLKKVDIKTKKVVDLGVNQATQGVFFEGDSFLFTRYQKQKSIQKYRGGQLRQIFKAEAKGSEIEIKKIPGFTEANCFSPTICQNEIYFLSDESGKACLYKYSNGGVEQVWKNGLHSIQSLSSDGTRLIMGSFGDVWILDPTNFQVTKAQIELIGSPQRESSWFSIKNELEITKNFKNQLNYYSLHEMLGIDESGERCAFLVRGSIFTNFKGNEEYLRIKPKGEGYYYDLASVGKNLYALYGDSAGNWLHVYDEKGDLKTYFLDKRARGRLVVNHDGSSILTTTAQQELLLFDLRQNKEYKIDQGLPLNLGKEAFSFSFDGKWIAYSVQKRNLFYQLKVFSIEEKKSYPLTASEIDGCNPVWHPQQAALYFLNRNGRNIGFSHSIEATKLVCAGKNILMAVSFNGQNPFCMDEIKEMISLKKELFDLKVYKKTGIGKPACLIGTKNGILVLGKETSLISFNKGTEETTDKYFYDVFFSSKCDKGIVQIEEDLFWADLSHGLGLASFTPVEITNQKISFDSCLERRYFFYSILRNYQSYFYDQKIEEGFWQELSNRYEALLLRVRNRIDFAYLISMMLAELNTLHIFVEPLEPLNFAFESLSLPIELKYSDTKGGFEIINQYELDPLVNESDLLDPYKNFTKGICIVGINNQPVQQEKLFEAHLEGCYGAKVTFELKDSEGNSQTQTVVPLSLSFCKEISLYDWSYKNRLTVDQRSKGEIGYIHLPAMDLSDYYLFTKMFSAMSDKQGIILDLRYNYGGWIHDHLIDHITSPKGVYSKMHNVDSPFDTLDCHPKIVILCNQLTHSSGEMVISLLKKSHDVTVIGTKTWGGGVGINTYASKVPGWLLVTLPAHAIYDSKTHEVLVEKEGAGPIDIYVDIDPRQSYLKEDLQLAKAIEVLIDKKP